MTSKTNMIPVALALMLALGLAFTGSASADVVDCTDATAWGANEDERFADECLYVADKGNPEAEEGWVNDAWDAEDRGFWFVGKWDADENAQDESVGDWVFTVNTLDDPYVFQGIEYWFSYSLQADPIYGGAVIDWVLGIGDGAAPAGGGLAFYLWKGITLDLGGHFRSFFSDADQFSHASGFVRVSEEPPGEPPVLIPEPSILALFGLGLLGMGWAIRRRRET